MDIPVLEIRRDDPSRTRLISEPAGPLAPGHVRLAVEHLALTANTVTYAVTGETLGYWDFFPASDAGWGRVPAMGHGRVIESTVEGIAPGMRCYGWFPFAGTVDLRAAPTANGFFDDGAHRAAHAPVYRQFLDVARDPLHRDGTDHEHRDALLRGLFITAYLADCALERQAHHGAEQVVISSASSKTAIAMAARSARHGDLKVIGLTSRSNLDFVRSLPWYDEVLDYEDSTTIDPAVPTVIVDMAGNRPLLARLHDHFGDALCHSMAIGLSHRDAGQARIGGACRPQFFFAPTEALHQIERIGPEAFTRATAEALQAFIDASRDWLEVEVVRGAAAAQSAWRRVASGSLPPSTGLIVVPQDA